MPLYIIIMALYTIIAVYILYLVIVNTIKSKDIWTQILSIFVIVPFLMRILFIK